MGNPRKIRTPLLPDTVVIGHVPVLVTMVNYIIESVDSISRDGPDVTYT